MDEALQSIAQWLSTARSAVALTGAGISTESGIPDFRSPGGVWSRNRTIYFDEFLTAASARDEYWRQKAEAHREFADAQPNAGHRVLADWEREGRIRGVITQNIDGLHQAAGSDAVLQLHGTAREASCLDCGERRGIEPYIEQFSRSGRAPACPACGGRFKHATISFGQALPQEILAAAADWAREADLMLVVGSSLVVTPAADLPLLTLQAGGRLAIINRDPTPLDRYAEAVVRTAIGVALPEIAGLLR